MERDQILESVKVEKRGKDAKKIASKSIAGEFDFYLFSESWGPRFCCTNSKQCKVENYVGRNEFQIHGLWPSFYAPTKDGKLYPSYCSQMGNNNNNNNDVKEDDDYQFPSKARKDTRKHYEFKKHGSCTKLSAAAYYREEKKIFSNPKMKKFNEYIESQCRNNNNNNNNNNNGKEQIKAVPAVPVQKIQDLLGGSMKVLIKSNKYCQLEEITTCWSRKTPRSNGGSKEYKEEEIHIDIDKGKDKNSSSSSSSSSTGVGVGVGDQLDCSASLIASSRNSAVSNHKCQTVMLDFWSSIDSIHSMEGKGMGMEGKGRGSSVNVNEKGEKGNQTKQLHCQFVSKLLLSQLRNGN